MWFNTDIFKKRIVSFIVNRVVKKFIKGKTRKFLQSKSLPQIPIEKCVGVGTAITNATGLKGNKNNMLLF